MALVKGSSHSDSLDHMARIIHLAAFALEAPAYFEYVESSGNWADEISRCGLQGPWALRHGFQLQTCEVALILLRLPPFAVINVFTCL